MNMKKKNIIKKKILKKKIIIYKVIIIIIMKHVKIEKKINLYIGHFRKCKNDYPFFINIK